MSRERRRPASRDRCHRRNVPIAVLAEITRDETLEHLDLGLLVFFMCEVLIRVCRAVIRRRWDGWLALDALIVGVALLPVCALPVVRLARFAHLGRHAHHLLRHVTIVRAVHAL